MSGASLLQSSTITLGGTLFSGVGGLELGIYASTDAKTETATYGWYFTISHPRAFAEAGLLVNKAGTLSTMEIEGYVTPPLETIIDTAGTVFSVGTSVASWASLGAGVNLGYQDGSTSAGYQKGAQVGLIV